MQCLQKFDTLRFACSVSKKCNDDDLAQDLHFESSRLDAKALGQDVEKCIDKLGLHLKDDHFQNLHTKTCVGIILF